MKNYMIQITSGQGPAECEWVVARLLKIVVQSAIDKAIKAEVVQRVAGSEPNTLFSANISLQGENLNEFINQWQGSVLWTGQSMYRKFHKRKNWFVGINVFETLKTDEFDERLVEYTTMRASGPGGQHVNKTESAVRATYKGKGLSVTASYTRSQLQNKKLALERLKVLVTSNNREASTAKATDEWLQHTKLERGNAIRVFEGIDFKEKKQRDG
ncbi:MAG: peptide chain release factor [Bacteroidota bacterium]|jgi:peptide chain release factor